MAISRSQLHGIGAAQLVVWGATFYAIPPLFPHVSAALDVTTATLTLALTVGLVLNAVLSLAVAVWIHRRGARGAMVAGSIAASLALLGLGSSSTAPMACTSLALLGAAHAALLYEPAFAAISVRLAKPVERTRAIQVITFWGGWAALWALPASSLLADTLGWRATLAALAALVLLTVRIHARLPAHLPRASTPRAPGPPISLGLALAFALGAIATTAVAVNGVLMLCDRELALADASLVFALLAPAQVLARVWFMRRNGALARHDGALPFALVGLGVISLLAAPSIPALVLFVVLFGAGAGLLTTIRAAVVVVRVSPEHAAKQLAAYGFVTSLARAIAPALASWLHVWLGYELALLAFATMALVAAAVVWRATSCTCANTSRAACSSWLTDGGLSCA